MAEGLDILLLREEELEEADTSVLAGLLDAEQHEVIRYSLLAHLAVSCPPEACERLDGVLGGIVGATGLFADYHAPLESANVNLYCGGAMLIFGAIMLLLAWHKSR